MVQKTQTLAARIVAQSDVKAERLISLLRMALAAMLFGGVSYILSLLDAVAMTGRKDELEILRLGAIAYFCLGALNFYCSDPRRYKPWMSWVFSLAEVALVSFQLYVDVADPQTPSLLAFASPVLLVVALVICVQALRSQVYLHVATSAFLLIACGVILFHDPQIGQPLSPAAIAELKVVYSAPPNVMRLLMLFAMATLIGTAVYKSKKLVERVAQETETAENRKRFIPNEISDAMSDLDIEALRHGQERELAAMFIDIRGFTGLSEQISPRETAALLGQFRALVTDRAIENGGIVDKFIGDGALLIFGLRNDAAQASRQALQTARSILDSAARWNDQRRQDGQPDIDLAIGAHTGPAIIGAVGDQRRLEFTAIGTTINLASRLEEIAKQHDRALVVSRALLVLADEDPANFHPLGPINIRGTAQALEIFAL